MVNTELIATIVQGEVVFPVLMEDEVLHTEENNFYCGKPDCPCQELLRMWNELQAVPSYVEQQAKAWSSELELEIED